MRRLAPLAVLLLAACATTPRPVPMPVPAPIVPVPPPVPSGLNGMTQADLQQRFGPAPFQLREGPGLKLQWQNTTCILDAYLYPPPGGSGAAVVAHVDTRRPGSGESIPQPACIASLQLAR